MLHRIFAFFCRFLIYDLVRLLWRLVPKGPLSCAITGVGLLLIGTAGAVYFGIYGYKYESTASPATFVGSSVGAAVLGALMVAAGLRMKHVEQQKQQVQGPPISS
jgi:hypothetical protein